MGDFKKQELEHLDGEITRKEQNEIIRNEKDRILVVQGAAGSGKTSIPPSSHFKKCIRFDNSP